MSTKEEKKLIKEDYDHKPESFYCSSLACHLSDYTLCESCECGNGRCVYRILWKCCREDAGSHDRNTSCIVCGNKTRFLECRELVLKTIVKTIIKQ